LDFLISSPQMKSILMRAYAIRVSSEDIFTQWRMCSKVKLNSVAMLGCKHRKRKLGTSTLYSSASTIRYPLISLMDEKEMEINKQQSEIVI